ncbi:MAG TPA: imidazole glycerol phosphate synthase subunit HisH [Gemmatimonadaceae bacterium]|jgi:glutamine amidotransferase|nr:imidazole glycerol phosphate synthase subunit HisH [Gemmatimonadaceae bacterium]
MRVTIFDYGAGNIHSLAKAIAAAGGDVVVQADPVRSIDTDALVLPGVGAFGAAASRLTPGRTRMRDALKNGLPCLGICLGMQLLLDRSDEAHGGAPGLGLIAGRVTRLTARRVPQIGWNTIEDPRDALFERAPLEHVYYANSYVCRPDDPGVVRAWSVHDDDRFPAVVRTGRTVGVQFHPEKSSRSGLRFLRAFLDEARA